MLIVVDIDGTVANIMHRVHYVRSYPANWGAFAKAIPLDIPETEIIEVIKALSDGDNTIIFASGRSEDSRLATEKWLHTNGIYDYATYSRIYMRKVGDKRKDDVIKEEILEEIIKDYGKKPDLAIDDRLDVCRLWHKHGIKLLRVGNPDLDNNFNCRVKQEKALIDEHYISDLTNQSTRNDMQHEIDRLKRLLKEKSND